MASLRPRFRRAVSACLAFGLVFWVSMVFAQNRNALTNEDVMRMARLKFDDTTIIQTIQLSDTNFDLSVAALVTLKEQGVSQPVIQTMLAAKSQRGDRPDSNGGLGARDPKKETKAEKAINPQSAASTLQPGTYVWTGKEWGAMQSINMSGGGGKHMAKMLVPGLTPQMVWTFHGGRAPVQVQDGKPPFLRQAHGRSRWRSVCRERT